MKNGQKQQQNSDLTSVIAQDNVFLTNFGNEDDELKMPGDPRQSVRLQKVREAKDKINEQTEQYQEEVKKMQDEIKQYKEEIKRQQIAEKQKEEQFKIRQQLQSEKVLIEKQMHESKI